VRAVPPMIVNGIRSKRRLARRSAFALCPPVGRVDFGDLRRLQPISARWGYDRGRPIDRYYVERFLARHRADIRGRVLEIGDARYTTLFGGSAVDSVEILDVDDQNTAATIVADLAAADHVAGSRFDCAVVTQTLHSIYDIAGAVRTLRRILVPGGVLLATMPGVTAGGTEDEMPWQWSLTSVSAARLFGEIFGPNRIEVASFGNVLAAMAFLTGLAEQELTEQELDANDRRFELIVAVRAVRDEEPGR
jgi:SAM-dependent methyltransferase